MKKISEKASFASSASIYSLATVTLLFPFTGAAFHNILLLITLVFYYFSQKEIAYLEVFKQSPTVKLGVILFLYLFASTAWNNFDAQAISALLKYRVFILIGFLAALLYSARNFRIVYLSLTAGLLLSLASSYLIFFDIFPKPEGVWNSLSGRILHGLQMNVLLILALHQLIIKKKNQAISSFLVITIILNLIFIEPGRTSQLTMFTLIFLFLSSYLKSISDTVSIRKKTLLFVLTLSVPLWLFYYSGNKVFDNSENLPSEISDISLSTLSRSDVRFAYSINGLRLIAQEPTKGYGLGNVGNAYKKLKDAQILNGTSDHYRATDNLHNQFLQIIAETGIFGGVIFTLFIFSILFIRQHVDITILGVFALVFITSSVNSSFKDHGDSWFLLILLSLFISKAVIAKVKSI